MPASPLPRNSVVLENLYEQCATCLDIAERVVQRDFRRYQLYLRLADGTNTFEEVRKHFERVESTKEEMLDQFIRQIESLWRCCNREQVAKAKYLHTFGAVAVAEGCVWMQQNPWFANMISMGYPMAARGQLMHVDLLRKLKDELVEAINQQPAKPTWNRETGKLMFRGQVVRRVRSLAGRIRPILNTFEDAVWVDRVEAPSEYDPQTLRETVAQLNKGLKSIRFWADGSGRGVIWEAV
jgi:hypothetical protein